MHWEVHASKRWPGHGRRRCSTASMVLREPSTRRGSCSMAWRSPRVNLRRRLTQRSTSARTGPGDVRRTPRAAAARLEVLAELCRRARVDLDAVGRVLQGRSPGERRPLVAPIWAERPTTTTRTTRHVDGARDALRATREATARAVVAAWFGEGGARAGVRLAQWTTVLASGAACAWRSLASWRPIPKRTEDTFERADGRRGGKGRRWYAFNKRRHGLGELGRGPVGRGVKFGPSSRRRSRARSTLARDMSAPERNMAPNPTLVLSSFGRLEGAGCSRKPADAPASRVSGGARHARGAASGRRAPCPYQKRSRRAAPCWTTPPCRSPPPASAAPAPSGRAPPARAVGPRGTACDYRGVAAARRRRED